MIKHIIAMILILCLCLGIISGDRFLPQPPAPAAPSQPSEPSTAPSTEPLSVTLMLSELTLESAGATCLLYRGPAPIGQVEFSSDDTSIATFVAGVVTAVAEGTTTVHASYLGSTASCTVKCVFPTQPPQTQPPPAKPPISAQDRLPVLQPPVSFDGASTFFTDAVFIGDSVSRMLGIYNSRVGLLAGATFISKGSYSVRHAVDNTMLLDFRGKAMKIEDAINESGCKKVFLMLGMNDIGIYGVTKTMNRWKVLLTRLKDNCPDIQIYIQSATPIYTGSEIGALNNERMDAYNANLKEFSEANGCTFIDVASYLKDHTGGLAAKYTSDRYVHLSNPGSQVWIDVLKAFFGC